MACDQNDQERIKVLITSIDGPEYKNSAWFVGKALLERGNDVYIANRKVNKSIYERGGFKFIAFEDIDPEYTFAADFAFIPLMPDLMIRTHMPIFERLKNWQLSDGRPSLLVLRAIKVIDIFINKIVETLKPDIIVAATKFPLPYSMRDKIPVIPIYSTNPIALYYKSGLHPDAGLSVYTDKQLLKEYREAEKPVIDRIGRLFSNFYKNYDLEIEGWYEINNFARYFGIYPCPEPLDYRNDLSPAPSNWVRFDRSYQEPEEKMILPEPFNSKPGKLIFLSIPSISRIHVAIVNRLINTFSRSKHRVIILRGAPEEQMKLPDNMLGDFSYPKSKSIISQVDLIINEGIGEVIFESLYFAKPMIIMPLVPAQMDSAQRLEDLKIGFRFNPLTYDEIDIHAKVETLLTDVDLNERLRKFSKQMRDSNNCAKVAEMVEKTARTRISPI